VALLLDAVRQGKGDGAQMKRAANSYLTRAEELSQVLDRNKQEADEAAKSSKGGSRAGSSLFAPRRASAPPAAAGVGAAARRPSKPDDYDYTGGRAARGRGGAAAGAGTVGGRGVVGRGGATGKAANGGGGGRGGGPANELETIVMEEMLDKSPGVTWDQIAGLEEAKRTLQEAVVLPNLRPDLFKGLRAPPRGVLLFG
jgi:spastin